MLEELLKKELSKKELLEKELSKKESKYKRDININDYKVKKLDEPIRVVVLSQTLKRVYPTSISNAIGKIKEGYIFESSEIYYRVNDVKDVMSKGYYKDSEGRFILVSATREVIQSKDFGIAKDNIVLKRFFNQTASKLANINKGELFIIRCKFKIGSKIVYNIIYKGKFGYIVEPNIEETNNVTVEDCSKLIKDLVMNI